VVQTVATIAVVFQSIDRNLSALVRELTGK
jgi:hypothetical protein